MSLNYSKIGHPLAIIKGGKEDKTKIYLNDKEDEKIKSFQKISIKDGVFQQIPDTKRERDVIMICGASGSGKSTWCRNYCVEYKKSYKNRPIYLFSHLDEDKTLDDLGYINRIEVGENLLEEPLTVKDFQDCLILFDDVEIITNKMVKKAVYQLLNECIMTGRHFNISVIMISHAGTGNEVKRILQECQFFVYFPHGQNLTYTLNKYLGIDNKQIKQIKATKSRWASINKNYPQCVITEKHLFMLSTDD
jgi:septin family protein